MPKLKTHPSEESQVPPGRRDLRVLVLGGTGMLGHKLCQLLPHAGCRVTATVRQPIDDRQVSPEVFGRTELIGGVDVLNDDALQSSLTDVSPDVVVNCIGVVKQKSEAEDRYLSVALNAFLPHRLAKWCAEQSQRTGKPCRLIHISTDCVFDGKRGRYRETDSSDAADLYGKTKFLGETDEHEPTAVTLRTSIIGRELAESHHGLLEWFLSQRGGMCRGFARAMFSGFTTQELSRVILRVIERPQMHGLYQVASRPISKYDLLKLIDDAFGTRVNIERDESFVCDRSLLMERFSAETGYAPPEWEAMIRELAADPTPYDAWTAARRELEARWSNHELPC